MLKRAGVALLWALVPDLAEAQVPVGPEFQVNAYTTGQQTSPSVAPASDGGFVVVWTSVGQDGSAGGVFARLYDASGAAQAAEFQVNSYTTSDQLNPAVASDADGNFVVVWQSFDQAAGFNDVWARRFDASGTALDAEFQVNSYSTADQTMAVVASDAAGNFVVVWSGRGQGDYGVFARRYSSSGTPFGGDFRVNSYTTGYQGRPAVVSDATGDFVVAWISVGQTGDESFGVFGQRYDATGAPRGGEFHVNSFTTGYQGDPALASDGNGNFVVAWTSNQDGSGAGVFGRRYDAFGPQGAEFPINTYITSDQRAPTVARDASGSFVVGWESKGQDGYAYGIFGQHHDASGASQGGELQFNSQITGSQQGPAAAATTGGGFVVTWTGYNQDGSGAGVFGQRFAADVIFRDGFE